MEHESTEMKDVLPYRSSVGLCIFNKKGQVFLAERRDKPGSWQMPQGGVNDGEDYVKAVFREMKEEAGNDKGTILAKHPEKLCYEFPAYVQSESAHYKGQFRGQEQVWFAILYEGQDSDINLTSEYEDALPEFMDWRWTSMEECLDLIVDFKRPVYEKVSEAFTPLGKSLAKGEVLPAWSGA